jgi:hypothetical protein
VPHSPTSAEHESYEDWRARRRYSVVCNRWIGRRSVDRVIARGMVLEDARTLRDRLQSREHARPGWRSSWTARLFSLRLETPWRRV